MGDKGFTRNDMERIGVFQEMGYITINDKYKQGGVTFNEAAGKNKQMLPGGSKDKSALQAGYFNEKYNRVLEGEAYSDPIKIRRQYRLKEATKNIGKAFLPSNGDKKMSGLGGHYGTLGGPVPAFSPQDKPKKPYKAPGKNVLSNPGKKGTGYGYMGVTLGPYGKHATDEYDRLKELNKKEIDAHRKALKGGAFKLNMHPKDLFDDNPFRAEKPLPSAKKTDAPPRDVKPFKPSSPGKMPAGMKAGTFDNYPSHSSDPYNVKAHRPVQVVNKTGKIFMPSAGPKSAPISSVVDKNVTKTINVNNYKALTTVMSY